MTVRYEPKPWDIRRCDMVETENGDWVRYSDFAAAQAEIDAMKAENERLTKLVSDSEKERYRSCAELLARAEKAEAERDEARLQLRHMEGFDCCTCFPCAIHSIETEQSALAARDAILAAMPKEGGE